MTDSNPLDLDNLRAYARAALERAEQATPGPWLCDRLGLYAEKIFRYSDKRIALIKATTGYTNPEIDAMNEKNKAFIASARLDVPNLAAAVLTLCAEREQTQRNPLEDNEELEGGHTILDWSGIARQFPEDEPGAGLRYAIRHRIVLLLAERDKIKAELEQARMALLAHALDPLRTMAEHD